MGRGEEVTCKSKYILKYLSMVVLTKKLLITGPFEVTNHFKEEKHAD